MSATTAKGKEPPSNQQPITAEELYRLGNGQRSELIKGKVKVMSPTGFLHGQVELRVASILNTFVSQHKLGRVMVGEVGIYIQRDPDTVRGADVLYLSQQRLDKVKSDSYLDVAPELVVEILSPNDYWAEINQKLVDYFSIAVDRVWIVDPGSQSVHTYKSLTDVSILQNEDRIKDEELFPGFSCKASDLFHH